LLLLPTPLPLPLLVDLFLSPSRTRLLESTISALREPTARLPGGGVLCRPIPTDAWLQAVLVVAAAGAVELLGLVTESAEDVAVVRVDVGTKDVAGSDTPEEVTLCVLLLLMCTEEVEEEAAAAALTYCEG